MQKVTELSPLERMIQQQVIDHPVVAAGAVDADLTDHRDASHDEHAGQLSFQHRRVVRGEQFRGSAQVKDGRQRSLRIS